MIKQIGIGVGVLVLVFAILTLVAPTNMSVQREITIDKPNAEVFAYIRSLKNQDNWNPWLEKDPNAVREHRGNDGEVGSIAAWVGNDEVGEGEQEIVTITEGSRIDTQVRFKKPMETTNTAFFATEALNENQTKLTWGMSGENRRPINVIVWVLNVKSMLEKDFDKGLAKAKALIETAVE